MTRRERLEQKVDRRQDWAAGRRAKADRLHTFTDQFTGDHAFNTQPGHIPLRARVIRMEDQAAEHATMAQHHDAKAAGLADQLERSVYSDDADAIAQLEARMAEHEATRDRMKLVNKLFKKGDAAGLAALGLNLESLTQRVAAIGYSWVTAPYESYQLTNLGARIRADKERIAEIQRRTARTDRAEAAGGVSIEGDVYVRVTFAEKPDRAVLDALKAAGFRWGGGSWVGARAALPASVNPTTVQE